MKDLILIYEPAQAETVASYCKEHGAVALALDYWAGEALKERGVEPVPLSRYVPNWSDAEDFPHAGNLWREWHCIPEMSFFTHRGLSLGEMTETHAFLYLLRMRACLKALKRALEKSERIERLVVPHPSRAGDALSQPETSAVLDAARLLAGHFGVEFAALGEPPQEVPLFSSASRLRTFVLFVHKMLVFFAPRRKKRFYVSDHWRNIRDYAARLDAEFLFVDRSELKYIPSREMWNHRVRFAHPDDAMTPPMRERAARLQGEWREAWKKAKSAVGALPGFTWEGIHWWSAAEPFFDCLVSRYAERLAADIESVHAVLSHERPDAVIIRASVSKQHHFYILGELSRRMGIPSVEVQHGIGVGILGPESVFGYLRAEYLLTYGELFRSSLVQRGYAEERIVVTGTPRFDLHKRLRDAYSAPHRQRVLEDLGLESQRPVALVIMPAEEHGVPFGATDLSGYEYEEYVRALARISKALPKLQLVVSLRTREEGGAVERRVRELLPSGRFALIRGEDPFPYMLASDVVYSCFSTAASQALLAERPLVLFPLKSRDKAFFEALKPGSAGGSLVEGALPTEEVIGATRALLEDTARYEEAVRAGKQFRDENFLFDGKASEHVARFFMRFGRNR